MMRRAWCINRVYPQQIVNTRNRLLEVIAAHGWARISEAQWNTLRDALPGISEATLRKHLNALAVPVDQPWRGVDITSLNSLEETLGELTDLYGTRPQVARDVVIKAKDKARFVSRNSKVAEEKRALKSEMVEWMLVWLGDPRMFADWARMRRALLSNPAKQI
jgi:hypothetical protein